MTTPLDRRTLADCVATATLAPSLHNSQPWRFRIADGSVEVFADRGRQLEVLDPAGRELLISVGAAIFTLRVAIGMRGWEPLVTLFPDPVRPDLVGRVGPGRAATPTASWTALSAAVAARHTNRRPFADAVVPADSMEQLADAAAQEGATLSRATAAAREMIIGLGRTAEARLQAQGRYRTELGRWTRSRPQRRDGVPPTAYGPWDALEHLPLRDFGLVHPQQSRPAERFEPYPTITVLATGGDTPADWIRAGQALQRVLLTATRLHLATTPISQPLELPALRDMLCGPANATWPQMIVRLGYAEPADTTPRRPLADVLETETAADPG